MFNLLMAKKANVEWQNSPQKLLQVNDDFAIINITYSKSS